MHYSNNSASVRVDFFKPTGKWKYTEAVLWYDYSKEVLIHDAFAVSLYNHLKLPLGKYRMSGLIAICLDPYHELAHPLMMFVDNAIEQALNYKRKIDMDIATGVNEL